MARKNKTETQDSNNERYIYEVTIKVPDIFRPLLVFLKRYFALQNPANHGPEVCIPLWALTAVILLPIFISLGLTLLRIVVPLIGWWFGLWFYLFNIKG